MLRGFQRLGDYFLHEHIRRHWAGKKKPLCRIASHLDDGPKVFHIIDTLSTNEVADTVREIDDGLTERVFELIR